MTSYAIHNREARVALVIGAALLCASYSLFSFRAVTSPFQPGELLSVKRMLVTAVGAGMFLFVARRIHRDFSLSALATLGRVAVHTLAAIGAVCGVRVGYDLLASGGAEAEVVRNMRWTIIWAGYFGAALLGYLAIILAMAMQRASVWPRGARHERMAAVLIEIGSWGEADRRKLVAALDRPCIYEEADPLFR
jgi:hypothetical protein